MLRGDQDLESDPRPHGTIFQNLSCKKYSTVLAIICTAAMVPAMLQLPEINQEITNVAPDPVMRQVMVLTKLLL